MALEVLVPRSASQIIGVLAVDTRDGYGCSLPAGAYRIQAINPAVTWWWATTDELAPGAMNEVSPGDEVSFTGPQTSLYFKGEFPITLQVTFDPPLAALPPDGGMSGAKTIVVSATGDDAAGAASPYTAEFLTIQAAIDAATSGDVVVVRPGTYSTAIATVLKDGVNLFGLPGAVVSAAANQAVFSDGGVNVDCRIMGHFRYISAVATMVLRLSASVSRIVGECDEINIVGNQNMFFLSGNGGFNVAWRVRGRLVGGGRILTASADVSSSITIEADSITGGASESVISIDGGAPTVTMRAARSITGAKILTDVGSSGGTRVSIKAPLTTATDPGDHGISVDNAGAGARYDIEADVLTAGVANHATGGEVHINAKTHVSHRSGQSALIAKAGSTTFGRWNECRAAAGSNYPAITMEGAAGKCHVLSGRIMSAAAGAPCQIQHSSAVLLLYSDAVLIAGAGGATVSIDTDGAALPTVIAMGTIAADKAKHADVTIAVGSLLVDAAVV